jgi:hypothetical protein
MMPEAVDNRSWVSGRIMWEEVLSYVAWISFLLDMLSSVSKAKW